MKHSQSCSHLGRISTRPTQFGVLFLLAVGLSVPSIGQAPEEKSLGQETFESQCVSCHGNDCKGKTITSARFSTGGMAESPDLTSVPWKYGSDPSSLERVISEGVGRMPAHKDKLSAAEIRAVTSYMLELCGVTKGESGESEK